MSWHGVNLGEPDFGEHSHSIALEMKAPDRGEHVFLMINAFWEPLSFELPRPDHGCSWHRLIDSSLSPGEDCLTLEEAPGIRTKRYRLTERSVAMLVSLREDFSRKS
jgi:glycogen operon protein